MPINKPTADDMARDLEADMGVCDKYPADECPFLPGTFGGEAVVGWPAAIRRAVAAEAEIARLNTENEGLTEEVSDLQNRLDDC